MERLISENFKLINLLNEIYDGSLDNEKIKELVFLNNFKFKTYELFNPGLSFFEHLYLWLKNFDIGERKTALELIFSLLFFSQEELRILARQIFQEQIKRYLLNCIIKEKNLDYYNYKEAYKYFEDYLDQSLFIALSDGAMIDYFRRVNELKNDQAVSYYKLHLDAQFKLVFEKNIRFFFLIEDFVASGTTFIRDKKNVEFWLDDTNFLPNIHKKKPPNSPLLDGQLIRFLNYWHHLIDLNKENKIIFCPYLTTTFALKRIQSILKYYGELNYIQSYKRIEILSQMKIPDELRVIKSCSDSTLRNIKEDVALEIENLCIKYYKYIKKNITDSQKLGKGIEFGFANRGYAIVRYNNIPNNTISLLWYSNGWNPLFPRRNRFKK